MKEIGANETTGCAGAGRGQRDAVRLVCPPVGLVVHPPQHAPRRAFHQAMIFFHDRFSDPRIGDSKQILAIYWLMTEWVTSGVQRLRSRPANRYFSPRDVRSPFSSCPVVQ
ncbi:hypothetical protein WME75_17525 [Sorangium sp. So ce1014]|uniref:hypothetical protein n=1 Tax=Sorangium sp. So ce1014 TaxID=3133326 RepID=UPI003F60FC0E